MSDVDAWGPELAAALDTRRGRERQQARPTTFTGSQVDIVLEVADSLGLVVSAAPARNHYDLVVVLGGTSVANRLRSELCAHIKSTSTRVVGLGSTRTLTDGELTAANDGARIEADDLIIALRTQGLVSTVFTAQPESGATRATTPIALAQLFSGSPQHSVGDVLLVTSAIYLPYQFFSSAAAVFYAGASSLEIIGTTTQVTQSEDARAQAFGQEIGAALSAARRLI